MSERIHIDWREGWVDLVNESRPGVHVSICIGNLATFAVNLAVAGALCDSFRLGLHAGLDADESSAAIRDVFDLPEPFFPGHALPSQPNTKGEV